MKPTDYAIVLVPLCEQDGGGYAAFAPDLPGCIGDGETQEEATKDILDAISNWIDAAKELGREIPAPGAAVEKARKREGDLIGAIKAILDYADHADGTIQRLEETIRRLEAMARNGNGHYRHGYFGGMMGETHKADHVH